MNIPSSGSWPNMVMARSLLRYLAGYDSDLDSQLSSAAQLPQIASWLVAEGLGPTAFWRCKSRYPQLANLLQGDAFSTAAENSIHWHDLDQVSARFAEAGLSMALLKGAALAEDAYGGRDRRTMSDVDIWVPIRDLAESSRAMTDIGFTSLEKADRPRDLQMLSNGEIQFYRKGQTYSLVELHMSPFSGWWLTRTADINVQTLWSRVQPLTEQESAKRLAAEDMVIHLAVHMAVNHQCGFHAIRSLLDIAFAVEAWPVDWVIVAKRAQRWRVGTAVWHVLYLLKHLVGTPNLDGALDSLQPHAWQRKMLLKLISPESLMLGVDIRSGRIRLLYLLLLVDRLRDMVRLMVRSLWPEQAWLRARYGGDYGHWHHLNRILRSSRI